MIRKIFIFLLISSISLTIQAQEPVSIHLSEKNELPDKEFYDIIEDSKGFIWLSADKGLFKYDGKSYKNYTHPKQRGLSVFNTQEDHLGRIWCNNISGQFFYIENDELHLYIDLSGILKGELVNYKIEEDFLIIYADREIHKIDLITKEIVKIFEVKMVTLSKPIVYNNSVLIGSTSGIYNLSSDYNITTVQSLPINLKDPITGKMIVSGKNTLLKIKNTLYFRTIINNKNTFFKLNIDKQTTVRIADFDALADKQIYNHFETENAIWFATSAGIWVYEKSKDSYILKSRFLTTKNVTKVIKDKDDNFWLITLNDGIYIVPNINIKSLPGNFKNVTSLDIINNKTLVYGNTKGNLGFYNIKTHKNTFINLKERDRVSKIRYHPKLNSVYIATDFRGYILNINNNQLVENTSLITAKSLTVLKDNQLLLTSNKGVVLFDNNRFVRKNEVLFNQTLRTYESYFDSIKNTTYIAYVDALMRFDSVWKGRQITYKNKPIFGRSITKTANGIVWVGTFKNGIYGLKNDSIIKHYSIKNGLTSNYIEKIKADENKLWIASENSIQLLNTSTNNFQTFKKVDGIISYDISDIVPLEDKIYFSSNEGLFSIDKKSTQKVQQPEVYFNIIEINEQDSKIKSSYKLEYNQNAIKIGFNVNGFLYNQKNNYNYRLKGFNNDWITTDSGINFVKYNSLPAGEFIFEVQPIINGKPVVDGTKQIAITIAKPFWNQWWFRLGIAVLLFGSTVLYFRRKSILKEKERRTELEKISLEKELIAINLTALRSQMNPHFIFNALNSIQDLILRKDTDASYDYIVLFAELIRNTLSYSNQDFIAIDKELRFLNVYLQLEELRFGDDFIYQITSNTDDDLEIPSLLVQPFIENALVHGLMHKNGKKTLKIDFIFKDDILQCIITDNGIGRKKAGEIISRQGNHHESFALKAIKKRLEIFKKQFNTYVGYHIEDLYENDISLGTKVVLTLPFKKRF